MNVTVNGESRALAPSATLQQLIELLGVQGRYAVEVNGEIIPKSAHAIHALRDGDRIEVVQAIGGG